MTEIDSLVARLTVTDEDICPVCTVPFKAGDTCATDIELGMCHAACLEGSPVVNLDTGEPTDGPVETYPYEPPLGTGEGSSLLSDPLAGVTTPQSGRGAKESPEPASGEPPQPVADAGDVAGEIVDRAYVELSPWLREDHDPHDVIEAIRTALTRQSEQTASLTKERDGALLACKAAYDSLRRFPGSVHDRAMAKLCKALGNDPDRIFRDHALEAAESRLAELEQEAVKVVEPFALNACHGDGTGAFDVPDGHAARFHDTKNPAVPTLFEGDFRRARAFLDKLRRPS